MVPLFLQEAESLQGAETSVFVDFSAGFSATESTDVPRVSSEPGGRVLLFTCLFLS